MVMFDGIGDRQLVAYGRNTVQNGSSCRINANKSGAGGVPAEVHTCDAMSDSEKAQFMMNMMPASERAYFNSNNPTDVAMLARTYDNIDFEEFYRLRGEITKGAMRQLGNEVLDTAQAGVELQLDNPLTRAVDSVSSRVGFGSPFEEMLEYSDDKFDLLRDQVVIGDDEAAQAGATAVSVAMWLSGAFKAGQKGVSVLAKERRRARRNKKRKPGEDLERPTLEDFADADDFIDKFNKVAEDAQKRVGGSSDPDGG